jgi:hypothetical protein
LQLRDDRGENVPLIGEIGIEISLGNLGAPGDFSRAGFFVTILEKYPDSGTKDAFPMVVSYVRAGLWH